MARNTASKQETAARILEAADEVIGDVGYDGASVADIAARAGVNKALVFYYFNSKLELLERVLERYYAGHAEALAGAVTSSGSLRDRLHGMMDAYLDFIAANRRYPRLVQHLVSGSGAHHALIQRNLRPLFEWITGALEEVVPAGGHLAARQFFVTFSGAVINYFTYAPVLEDMWGEDPMSDHCLEERRGHLHWMVDTFLDALEVAPQ